MQRRKPNPGETLRPGWFDRAEDLDAALDAAARPISEDTWGLDPASLAAHDAMMGNGPAPLKPQHRDREAPQHGDRR